MNAAFERWWKDEDIEKAIGDGAMVSLIRKLCEIAWSNGEYQARHADERLNRHDVAQPAE